TRTTGKSELANVWPEKTGGVARPRRHEVGNLFPFPCPSGVPPPNPKKANTFFCQSFFARSRTVARSGTSPRYQNSKEIVKYVPTAKTSHTRGLRNCGHSRIVSGYGNSQ